MKKSHEKLAYAAEICIRSSGNRNAADLIKQ